MAGDPADVLQQQRDFAVSIRARHRWRAIQQQTRIVVPEGIVSIRARHRWRAILHLAGPGQPLRHRFNPRPPSMAGDPG